MWSRRLALTWECGVASMQFDRPSPIFVCGTPCGVQKQPYFAKAKGQQFEAKVINDTTEIDLFDEIGEFGVSAKDFSAQLRNIRGNIVLRINSPGGDVFQGIAIYNSLIAHEGHVRVEVTGVAASAASIVAMAGDEIGIAENAFIMVHNAWGVTIGNQADHDEASDLLGQIATSSELGQFVPTAQRTSRRAELQKPQGK